jgi:hypothetical protein
MWFLDCDSAPVHVNVRSSPTIFQWYAGLHTPAVHAAVPVPVQAVQDSTPDSGAAAKSLHGVTVLA